MLFRCRGVADAHANSRLVLGLTQLALTAVRRPGSCCGLRTGNGPCLRTAPVDLVMLAR